MKKPNVVVVFGGSGLLGSRLVRHLAEKGWFIRLAERNPEKALPLKTAGDVGQIVTTYVNLKDEGSISSVLQGAHLVINLVGGPVRSSFFKSSVWDRNVAVAERIARLAHKAGVADMVHVSAAFAEGSEARYVRSKKASEEAVLKYFPKALIVRPNIMFGREDHFISVLSRAMRHASSFFVFCGNAKIAPVYVGDVAEGISKALDHKFDSARFYEFHGDVAYSYGEIACMLKAHINPKMRVISLSTAASYVLAFFTGFIPGSVMSMDAVSFLRHDLLPSKRKLDDNIQVLGFSNLSHMKKVSLDAFLQQNAIDYQVGGRFKKKYV